MSVIKDNAMEQPDFAAVFDDLHDKTGAELAAPELTPAQLLRWAASTIEAQVTEPDYTMGDVWLAILGSKQLPVPANVGNIDPILARVLSAPTLAAAMEAAETSAIEDVLGREVELSNPRWHASTFDKGALAFCVVECVDLVDGVVVPLVVGSQQPQTIIWRALVQDELPLRCRFIQSAKPTRSGYRPFSIVKA